MNKKNVYLVDMGSGSNMNLLPLAITMIGSYSLEQPEIKKQFNIEYRFLRQNGEKLASSMDNPVVVGFSCYVWNFRGSLSAAKEVKKRFPNALIVLGGFSIPKIPERISQFFLKNPFIDVLVHGEGELTFLNFLRQFLENQQYHEVQGLTYKTKDVSEGFISNPNAIRIGNLDELPSPFLNGTFDQIIKKYGAKITGALWETNRGCPYYCTFCDWGNAAVNKIKKYSMERLQDEIKWISKKEFYYMFFSDANFGIFKERDMEIAGYIADCHAKNGFPHHVITNWAKNKGENVVAIAERLAKSGIANNITMAIQSANPATLEAIKRRNLEQGKIDHLKSMFHDKHIPTYVEVILGLPLESYETFSNGLNTILSYRLEDRFFVYLCQMLENTEMDSPESREKYQLETRHCRHTVSNRKFEWVDEDTEYEEFVVGTSTMPIEDWVKSYVYGYFLTVLYNHRASFFPFIYLKEEFGVESLDIMEFIISQLRQNPKKFPVLTRSINHIDQQAKLMLEGVSSMNSLPEAEDLVVLPHVGAVVLLAKNKHGFYKELDSIFKSFFLAKKLEVDSFVFDEIIIYQNHRFPSWPQQEIVEHTFQTNIPKYFHHLVTGIEPIPLKKEPTAVKFRDHIRKAASFADFAAIMVRGGLTVDLLEADIQGEKTARDKDDEGSLAKTRWQMEQRNLDKLKSEYDRVTA